MALRITGYRRRAAGLARGVERLGRASSAPGTTGPSAFVAICRGRRLVADLLDHARRADERRFAFAADLGGIGVLRQEAVTRMERVGADDRAALTSAATLR